MRRYGAPRVPPRPRTAGSAHAQHLPRTAGGPDGGRRCADPGRGVSAGRLRRRLQLPSSGAHEVYGSIRARWVQQGWERGPLGYPVSGEYAVPGGRQSDFQGGSIRWDAALRTTEVLPR